MNEEIVEQLQEILNNLQEIIDQLDNDNPDVALRGCLKSRTSCKKALSV